MQDKRREGAEEIIDELRVRNGNLNITMGDDAGFDGGGYLN